MKFNVILIFVALSSFLNMKLGNDTVGFIGYEISRGDVKRQGKLYFTKSTSNFLTNTVNPQLKNNIDEDLGTPKTKAEFSDFVEKYFSTKSMITSEYLGNETNVIVNDQMPDLDWEILPDKKRIGNFTCQKAKTTFRCADYTAWFTTEIPLPIGPWKLGGLPGAILELNNDTVGENYLATIVEYPSSLEIPKSDHSKIKKTYSSWADYGKDAKKEFEKLQAYMKSKYNMPEDAEISIELRECY